MLSCFMAIATLLLGLDRYSTMRPWARRLYWGWVVLVLLRYGGAELRNAYGAIAKPPEWDFLCFWLIGRVAVLWHNVYAPASYHLLGDGLHGSPVFVRDMLDVGFVYPPISVVWFVLLGFFSNVHVAATLWISFLFLVTCGSIWLLWKGFFRAEGLAGLGAAAAIVLAFPPTVWVLHVTQTLFLTMTFALLFLRERNQWRAGLWIALAVSVKPFLIVLLLQPVLTRAWRTIVATVLSLAALAAVSLAIIGRDGWSTFFRANPVSGLVLETYTESVNQSLLSWILRLNYHPPAHVVIQQQTLYLVIVAAITSVTLILCARVRECDREIAIVLSLLWGLLVYPQTLAHYAVLLLIPIALLWSRRGPDRSVASGFALVIAAFSASLMWNVALALVTIALAWLAFALIALMNTTEKGGPIFTGRHRPLVKPVSV